MRLNKFLARYAGVSRREADRLIEAGEVFVGDAAASIGMSVEDGAYNVRIGSKTIVPDVVRHYYAVYKPVGYISSTVKQDLSDRLVTELVRCDEGVRLFPVGRLDKDSEGLIILTDDGELMDLVLRSRYGHEKEYQVELSSEISDAIISEIASGGIDIGEGRLTKPCKIRRISPVLISVVLTEGMNRQIRRVLERYGLAVRSLCRVRFMDITLKGLRPGESRELTVDEIKNMKEMAKAV